MRAPTRILPAIVFALAYAGLGLALLRPGIFIVDEAQYLMMGQALLEEGTWLVDNGLDEAASPELAFFLPPTGIPASLPGGRLPTAYPPLYALLVAPFAALFGLAGYFYLNVAAGAASLVILFLYARWLRGSDRFAWGAVLIFSLSTFFFEYTVGLWPHALSVALCLGGVMAVHRSTVEGRRFGLLLGGFLLGTGMGVRLIVIFALAAALLVLAHRRKWMDVALVVAGGFPPLLAFSLVNRARLGTFDIFSYLPRTGDGVIDLIGPRMLAVAGAGAVLLALAGRFRRPSPGVLAGALAVVIALAFVPVNIPERPERVRERVRTAVAQVVDYGFSAERLTPGAELTRGGTVSYYRTVKKGVLQSSPLLVLAILALLVPPGPPVRRECPAAGGEDDRMRDTAMPLVVVGIWGLALLMGFHGGQAFNTRYALEAIPFAVLVALAGIRDWLPEKRDWIIASVFGVVSACVFLLPGRTSVPRELFIRLVPLGLAATLAGARLRSWRRPGDDATRKALGVLVALAVVWGGAVHFTVDVPSAVRVRSRSARVAADVGRTIEADAAIFGWGGFKDPLAPLTIGRPDLVIGDLLIDGGASFESVADRFMAAGRPVWLLDDKGWTGKKLPRLRRYYDLREVPTPSTGLFRIERKRPDAPDIPLSF